MSSLVTKVFRCFRSQVPDVHCLLQVDQAGSEPTASGMFIMLMLSGCNLLHLRWLCRVAPCRVAPCLWCRLILETDPGTIASRVAMRGADTENLPLSEQVGTASCCALVCSR